MRMHINRGSATLRSARIAAGALALIVGVSVSAQAQAAELATPTPAPVVDVTAQPTAAPAGPTFELSRVGVHTQQETLAAPAAPAGQNYGRGTALMIVGGAAVLTGLLISNSAGNAIAVGGAVVGLYGLYLYLQ